MSCLRTTQLTDSELLMALDGEADPEVTMHIADCPDCRLRAGQLQKLQNGLTSRLFRAACPSSMDVGEYQLGLLPAAQALAIEKHLAECAFCSNERALLAGFLVEAGPTTKTDLLAPVKETHADPRCTIDDRLLRRTAWPAQPGSRDGRAARCRGWSLDVRGRGGPSDG